MVNEKLFKKSRNDIMKIAWSIIFVTFVCEIVYVVSHSFSKNELMFFISMKIVIPLFICVLISVFGQIIINKNKKEIVKNYACIFSIGLVSTCCILFNYTIIPLVWGMSISIYLSTIFADKKLMSWLCFFSYIVLLASLLLYAYTKSIDNHIFDYFISSILLGFSYVTAMAIVKFQDLKTRQLLEAYNVSKELKEQLKLDQLTGLYNHTNIHKIVTELISSENYLIMALIDIDNFKQVNDNYGHVSGDFVIEKLSEIIRNHVNRDTIGARYGGEEFVIVFKNISMDEAYKVIKEMGETFISYNFGFNVSFSCGLSNFANKDWTAKDFFSAADAMMYKAKTAGKNQICISDEKNIRDN